MSTHPPRRPVLVVVGNGMVGHKLLEAAVDRGPAPRVPRSSSSARSAGSPTTASASPPRSRAPTRAPCARWRPASSTTTASSCVLGDAVVAVDPDAGDGRDRVRATRSPTTPWCWPRARTRSCRRCRASDARRLLRLPHPRRPRGHPGLGRRAAEPGVGGRRRPARPRGGQRPAQPRASRPTWSSSPPGSCPCRSTTAAGAALRRRIEDARRRRAHRRGRHRGRSPTHDGRVAGLRFADDDGATTSTVDAGRVLAPASGPATSWPAAAGLRRGRAGRRRRRRRPAARPTRTIYAIGECALAPGRPVRTGWSRPATPWPGWSPTGSLGGERQLHRRRHVDQAQAPRRRRGQLRRRLRPPPTAPRRSSTATRSPASTRSWSCRRRRHPQVVGGMLVGDASAYQHRCCRWPRGDMPTPEHPER